MNTEISLFAKPEFWITLSLSIMLTISFTIKFIKKKSSVKAKGGSVAVGRDSNAPITIKHGKKIPD